MELSINEKKYLKKVIKKYPKKKIYKLIKKKDNLEISNDLKSLLTKMENVNFMDNYYEDMIGGMNSVLNSANKLIKGQNPNPNAQAGKQNGFQMQNFKNPFNRPQGAAGPVAAPAAGIGNAIGNLGNNITKSFQNMTDSLNQLGDFLNSPIEFLDTYAMVRDKLNNFIAEIQKKIGNLRPNLTYDTPYVSKAVEAYLLTLGVRSPFHQLFGRFYFNFVIKPYIQSTLQTYPKPYLQTYPIHYNEQNLVESPISDMYNNNINSYAPHMYYPINYNSIEKYPMDNHDGYYN